MNRLRPEIRPCILDIDAYVPGDSRLPEKVKQVVRLASNENPLGASPKAIEAVSKLNQLARYPDPDWDELRTVIASQYHISPDHIVAGAGSEQLIHQLCQVMLEPGDNIVQSRHGFIAYEIAASACGAETIFVDTSGFNHSIDNLLGAVTPNTKILFLDNPNNPSGTWLKQGEIEILRRKLPSQVLLVLDCAYAEYVTDPDYSAGHELVSKAIEEQFDNTIVLHTFSKLYGLASLRVGWGHMPKHIAEGINRLRPPFNVATPAQSAAVASLLDDDYRETVKSHNEFWRIKLRTELLELGLTIPESMTNFILIQFPGGAKQAQVINQQLREAGIITRPLGAYNLHDCLRVTVGNAEECDYFLNTMKQLCK